VIADLIDGNVRVGLGDRPGKAGAGGSQRLKPRCCSARALPTSKRIWNDESSLFRASFLKLARLSAVVTGIVSLPDIFVGKIGARSWPR